MSRHTAQCLSNARSVRQEPQSQEGTTALGFEVGGGEKIRNRYFLRQYRLQRSVGRIACRNTLIFKAKKGCAPPARVDVRYNDHWLLREQTKGYDSPSGRSDAGFAAGMIVTNRVDYARFDVAARDDDAFDAFEVEGAAEERLLVF